MTYNQNEHFMSDQMVELISAMRYIRVSIHYYPSPIHDFTQEIYFHTKMTRLSFTDTSPNVKMKRIFTTLAVLEKVSVVLG